MILCDIGNSSFDFLLNGVSKKFYMNEEFEYIDDCVYFISVNKKASKILESSCKKAINLEQYIDFTTEYIGLGLDRKVACLNQKNTIIVDAGSAITVDIMKNYKHLGGFILPGLKSFNLSYERISKVLAYDLNLKLNLDKIPLNTQDAISYSILKSIILPIKEISKNKNIIFTGGDGKILSEFFDNCIYKENLIFENMKGLINANYCIT